MGKMTLEQARKMRDGILKGDSAMSQAWKELLGGEPLAQAAQAVVASAEEQDTDKERKALGLPTREELAVDTEGW